MKKAKNILFVCLAFTNYINASSQSKTPTSLMIASSAVFFATAAGLTWASFKCYQKEKAYRETFDTIAHIEYCADSENSNLVHISESTINKLRLHEHEKDFLKSAKAEFGVWGTKPKVKAVCQNIKPRVIEKINDCGSFGGLAFVGACITWGCSLVSLMPYND